MICKAQSSKSCSCCYNYCQAETETFNAQVLVGLFRNTCDFIVIHGLPTFPGQNWLLLSKPYIKFSVF